MTMRLILLVHGETAATRRAAFPMDEALNARGQAEAAQRTPMRCDRALTSPARAARETAIALGLEATVDAGLRDIATGTWAGRTLAEVFDTEPADAAAFLADPGFAGHGGESIVVLVARLKAWLEDRCRDHGRVVATTHQAVARAAVVAVLGAPPSAFWQVDVGPLATVELRSNGHRWSLRPGSPERSGA